MRGKYRIFLIKPCSGLSVHDKERLEASSNDLNIIHKKYNIIKSRILKNQYHSHHCTIGWNQKTYTREKCKAEFEIREEAK